MQITSKFDKGDTIYVVVNNHFAIGKVLDVEFKEGKFFYKFDADDYHGIKTDTHVYSEDRCGASFDELCNIQKEIMNECHKKAKGYK